MTRPRGCSNTNGRGSSYQRRARKHWLLVTYQAREGEGLTHCYRCGDLLDWFTLTVDRIIPACEGGTYAKANIRPCCADDNSETGGALGAARRLAGVAS